MANTAQLALKAEAALSMFLAETIGLYDSEERTLHAALAILREKAKKH